MYLCCTEYNQMCDIHQRYNTSDLSLLPNSSKGFDCINDIYIYPNKEFIDCDPFLLNFRIG